jgi:hypothetical protein
MLLGCQDQSMNKQATSPRDEFLSIVKKSKKNGLEFLTPNDWILFFDRAKDMQFRNGEKLLQQRRQTKIVHVITQGSVRIEWQRLARGKYVVRWRSWKTVWPAPMLLPRVMSQPGQSSGQRYQICLRCFRTWLRASISRWQ